MVAVLILKRVCCLQKFLQPDHTVMVDTGDALFFVAKMLLPKHTRYSFALNICKLHEQAFICVPCPQKLGAVQATGRSVIRSRSLVCARDLCAIPQQVLAFGLLQKQILEASVVTVSIQIVVIYLTDFIAVCRFEAQMHYASIGWSMGACVGYQAALPERRVVNFVGDGSFQVTAVVSGIHVHLLS